MYDYENFKLNAVMPWNPEQGKGSVNECFILLHNNVWQQQIIQIEFWDAPLR